MCSLCTDLFLGYGLSKNYEFRMPQNAYWEPVVPLFPAVSREKHRLAYALNGL